MVGLICFFIGVAFSNPAELQNYISSGKALLLERAKDRQDLFSLLSHEWTLMDTNSWNDGRTANPKRQRIRAGMCAALSALRVGGAPE
jgi:hypothetical protein